MSHMPFASEGRNGFHRYVPSAAADIPPSVGGYAAQRQTRGAIKGMTGSEQEHGHRAHAVAVGHAPRKRRVARGLTGWRWNDLRRRALILVRSRFMLRVL